MRCESALIKKTKLIMIVLIIFLVNISHCSAYSDTVYSGTVNIYHVKSLDGEDFEGPGYKFYWVPSDGSYDSCKESIFKWTAPEVSEPRNVTIAVYAANSIDADSICVGKDEIEVTVLPRENGGIRLEKTLLSAADDIRVNDIITYRVCITNIGNSSIVSMPFLDDYPEQFLRAESSDLPWDEDTGSALAWIDLLNSTLHPGQSINININFRAIAASSLKVTNIARVIGARIENGATLKAVSAESTIDSIRAQCHLLGPSTGCIGSSIIFSSPSWSQGDRWMAFNASNNVPVGGFDDPTQSEVIWTPAAIGEFIISYNNFCKHKITIYQCSDLKGDLDLKKTLLGNKYDIGIGDVIYYRIAITNTGQNNISVLRLVEDYPEQFIKPMTSSIPWDEDNQSTLTWNDLLNDLPTSPLPPGNSITVSLSFRAIAPTNLTVVNLAMVSNAIDEGGASLKTKTAAEQFPGISTNCSYIGAESGYAGVPVTFSAPFWLDGDEWTAQDSKGRPVDGFNETKRAVVIWTPPYSGIFQISYNSQCKYYISIKNPSLCISKRSTKDAYSPQDTVKYTINYANHLELEADDVTIYDVLPDVEYMNSTPGPDHITGNTLIWKVGTMAPGTNGSIELFIRIKERPDLMFKEDQSVYGQGYVYSNKRLSTATPPTSLVNYANITAFYGREFNSSTCAIQVQDSKGIEFRSTTHGSGSYSKSIRSQLSSLNKTVQIDTDLAESFGISSFSLPRGRSIDYASRWSEMQMAKNRETGAFFEQQIMYAAMIKSNSSIALDKNGSIAKSRISFEGAGHFREQKMPSNNSSRSNGPAIYHSEEDYLGQFEVDKRFDEYGKNAVIVHSATGNGSISSEKRAGRRQMSYHSGTGAYQSMEEIQTQTDHMDKLINARYGPLNYIYPSGFNINISKKWAEGMCSRSGELNPKSSTSSEPASYIAEQISNAEFLNKITALVGLAEMRTDLNLSGTARFEAFSSLPSTSKDDSGTYLFEEYSGRYDISRKLNIGGVARFDEPHLNLTISGKLSAAGDSLIDYVINVTNDGNIALGPIIITDYFPPGTEYVSSSLRPSELNRSLAQWTLIDLGIGASAIIELRLNITEKQADSLINRVRARSNQSDKWTDAEALSSLQLDWLGCCSPHLSASKKARADPIDPLLVHYCISVTNHNNQTMTAAVRDLLPNGMVFQSSSPAATGQSTGEVLWTIADLHPEETRRINYTLRAMRGGIYVNRAHISLYSADASGYAQGDIASRIEVQGAQDGGSGSAGQGSSCLGLSSIKQEWTEDWISCGACENAQSDSSAWECSSCITSALNESDHPDLSDRSSASSI